MSLTILHGDHHVNSRAELQKTIDEAIHANTQIERIETKSLETTTLELLLGTQDLFAQPKLYIIETLHSLPQSKRKKELIELIAKIGEGETQIILWEKKALTATQLKKFSTAKQQLFKLSSALFQWLDLFGSKGKTQFLKLDEAVRNDGKEFCFLMLARQIRYLIATKSGNPLPGAPFMLQKLRKQATQFSLQQLFDIQERLTFLDYQMKIGQPINLVHEIQRLMLYS